MSIAGKLRELLGFKKPLTLDEAARTMSDEEASRTVAPLDHDTEATVRSVLLEADIPLSSNSHVTVQEYRMAYSLLALRQLRQEKQP